MQRLLAASVQITMFIEVHVHLPAGVDMLASPMIIVVTAVEVDPPGTEPGGKISMPVSIGSISSGPSI